MAQTTFRQILDRLRSDTSAADVLDAIDELQESRHAADVARYLTTEFGKDPKLTRVFIRAAGKSEMRELHDILVQRLSAPGHREYAYELIDAVSSTRDPDYAAAIIPHLTRARDRSTKSTAVYALGMLRSPVAILPLIRQYHRSRDAGIRKLALESLRRIVREYSSKLSLKIYLSEFPEKARDEIERAVAART